MKPSTALLIFGGLFPLLSALLQIDERLQRAWIVTGLFVVAAAVWRLK